LVKIRAIWHDNSLSREQKQAAVLKTVYPDSVNIPYASIKQIKFALGGDKKYRSQIILSGILMITADLFFISAFSENDSYYSNHDAGPQPFIATKQGMDIGFLALLGSLVVYHQACEKTIYTHDWRLKN
ncbi:MAG TPA: hypothetical protein VNZ45_16070, partial [Bacteroidia bacterium]|nr:hypothetical protein [Bacteroidia bacterium]